MSYNQNYYNYQRNDTTFQGGFDDPNFIPPPPQPPLFYIPPIDIKPPIIKLFEERLPKETKRVKTKTISISEVRNKIKELVTNIDHIKCEEKYLSDNMDKLTKDEWDEKMKEFNEKSELINKYLSTINESYMNLLRKLLAKRTAKRLRLKRVRTERKREKEDKIKESKERSRQIDEKLQKIQDKIIKAEQDEEAKLQADMVLKEVLRKKLDAKKCIDKLDALKKLHMARLNTAKGRGENVPESQIREFADKVNKLISMWALKLVAYKAEEEELREKLKDEATASSNGQDPSNDILSSLTQWREVLFGTKTVAPQRYFKGDTTGFIAVRREWDKFIHNEGSPLPVGWVVPVELK